MYRHVRLFALFTLVFLFIPLLTPISLRAQDKVILRAVTVTSDGERYDVSQNIPFFAPHGFAGRDGIVPAPKDSRNGPRNIEPDRVIDTDQRQQITNTNGDPWRRIVFIHYSSGASCSGFLYDDNTVATAGHCVYSGGWMFPDYVAPGKNGSQEPYGRCGVTKLFTVTPWKDQRNPDYDYGAIKLNCAVGNQTGIFGMRVESDSSLKSQVMFCTGYPSDKPFATLWDAFGTISNAAARQIWFNIDTERGQSGSPVYNFRNGGGYTAYGLFTNQYDPPTLNSGPRIIQEVYNNFVSWGSQ